MDDLLPLKDRMFQRLSNLIKERFDAVITFTDFSSRLRVADAKTIAVVQRNTHSNMIVMGMDIVLPIRSGTNLFGYVTIFNGLNLDQLSIDQIRDVTDLLLTESCALQEKSHKLKILEHYLTGQMSFQDVIDLKTRLESEEMKYINPEIAILHDDMDSVFPILVESHSEDEAREFAVEIHRTSERSSFLTFEPYLIHELIDLEKIKELGPITLFVPNIRKLPLDIQYTLAAYLRSPTRTTLHPRLIVAIQENPESLIAHGVFDKVLFEKLSAARLKLPPKGTSSMTIEEILGFFESGERNKKAERHLYLVTPSEPPH